MVRFTDIAAASNVWRLGLDNIATFREVREAITRFVRQDGLAEDERVLLDLREMVLLPTTPEAEALADELSSTDVLGRHAIALVALAGVQYGIARMICTMAELRGGHAQAFMDDRAAVDWLNG